MTSGSVSEMEVEEGESLSPSGLSFGYKSRFNKVLQTLVVRKDRKGVDLQRIWVVVRL